MRKYVLVIIIVCLVAIGIRFFYGNYFVSKKILKILPCISIERIDHPRYFEYSWRQDYYYPKTILLKFDCDSAVYLQIISHLHLINELDTQRIKKNIFITDIQTKNRFWCLWPDLFPNGKKEDLPEWWQPCEGLRSAFYYWSNDIGSASWENCNGKIRSIYCHKTAYFLIDLYLLNTAKIEDK